MISFRRVVNAPKRGIGDATVAALETFARDEEIDVLEAARRVDEIATLGTRAKGAVAGFTSIMATLRRHLEDGAGPARMVEFADQESGYLLELEEERTSRRRAGSRTSRSSPASRMELAMRAIPRAGSTRSSSRYRSSVSRTNTMRRSRASR